MNSPIIFFGFTFLNDGTSTSVSINLSTQPVFVQGSNEMFNPQLVGNSLSLTTAISAGGFTCDSGATITSSSILLGVLTVHLSTAGTAGDTDTIFGYLKF